MNENHDPKNDSEEQLTKLLSMSASRAAPPDEAFLSRLREQSTKAFLESQPNTTPAPKKKDLRWIMRTLAGLAAVAAVVVGMITLRDRGPSLHESFKNVANLKNCRLEYARFGDSPESFIRQVVYPGQILDGSKGPPPAAANLQAPYQLERYDYSNGQVLLRDERGKFWMVDEAENRKGPPPPMSHSIRTLYQLFSSESDHYPQETVEENGHRYYVYAYPSEPNLLHPPGLEIEWRVDALTRAPHSAKAFEKAADGSRKLFGSLMFTAIAEPVDESKFKIADTLTEDGRIGKFSDAQGFVSLRPKAFTRWTPICAPSGVVKPGDWVRTDIRGANAVAIQLVPETKLTLGPGSLVELLKPTHIKILSGEFELAAEAKHPVELTGPDGTKLTVKAAETYRVQGEKLVKLAKEPLWLSGFKGTTPQETLGSLIAKVDGRDVPLHVGYHKVSVEIRDQIARTTIEESFVNSTNAVLEGQFHFPLPADASISGFGMWVGDRLVEADIVEKQRAREIYETILREKRDPGLLEWSGGNIFKARVYPIPARGEKRIKIVYTQVLPREGNSYRYSYALQSELLRQFPVRELNLTVTVSSAQKLAGISCPTHLARLQNTEHSARAEFSAQEYSPTKDFEVVVQVEDDKQGVVMIPHRRGDDGYFLLLLSPPAEGGPWQRDVVPDGEPLKLIVLADTSASMDKASRKTQDEVLGALLASLGPKDSFELAACDVDCLWGAEKAQLPDAKSIEAARSFLAKRRSMGWTDLDKAFSEAIKKADGKTHVVYLGDGVVTTGDADAQAFAKRLLKMAEGKAATFHSIAVSSSYEAAVMKTIGSIGGGSVRNVSGEKGPQQTAKDLLAEIARPSLKNVQVKFSGLRTARVYPGTLTNLPLGTQQIVLGRYLPEGKDQKGEVIVTGTLAGKEVSYRAAVSLKDAEEGNSFIPRLWARMHLDELLAQGTSQSVQDEIINLSEEYHLMTPYTSLLVLESDADRERFKVKRRFQMRDGERFFADAKDKAQYELVQQQMRLAATWRLQLRNRVLAELARMGRNPEFFDRRRQMHPERLAALGVEVEYAGIAGRSSGNMSWGVNSGGGAGRGDYYGFLEKRLGETDEIEELSAFGGPARGGEEFFGDSERFEVARGVRRLRARELFGTQVSDSDNVIDAIFADPIGDAESASVASGGPLPGGGSTFMKRRKGASPRGTMSLAIMTDGASLYDDPYETSFRGLGEPRRSYPSLFPISLPRPPHKTKSPSEQLSKHTKEVRDLVLALEREEKVRALTGGLAISRETESFEPRFDELNWKTSARDLVSGKLGWLTISAADGSAGQVDWCDAKERGVWSPAYELALVRKAAKDEHLRWSANVEDYPFLAAVAQSAPEDVALEHPAEGQTLVILGVPAEEEDEHAYQTRFLIDTKRNVLLSVEERYGGKTSRTVKFADFAEVAGRFWPQTQETLDGEGRRISLTKISVKTLSADEFAAEFKAQQTAREPSLTLHLPLPTLAAAKKALTRLGELTPEVYLRLLIHAAGKQDWDQTRERLARIEELIKDKAWYRWLQQNVLAMSRRHEELKGELMKMGADLAAKPHAGEMVLASALLEHGSNYLATQEYLELLEALRPVYARAPAYLNRLKDYDETRLRLLVSLNRFMAADALRKELAERYPRDVTLQTQYASWLGQRRDYEAAYAWLTKTIADERPKWQTSEIYQLQWAYLDLLEQQGRYADRLAYLAPIVAKNPENDRFYTHYLIALYYLGRDADADKTIKEWLVADLSGKGKGAARIRVYGAVLIAMNEMHPFGSRRYDVSWHKPLAEFVSRNAVNTDNMVSSSVRSVLQNSQFASSDEMVKLSRTLAARLLADADKLTPRQLEKLVEHVRNSRNPASDEEWQSVAKIIQARWEKEKPGSRRERLLDEVLRNIHQETGAEARLAYLRLRVKRANDESRPDKQRQLFDELIGREWTVEIEAETIALLDKLASGDTAESRLLEQLSHLHRWTDRMQEARRTLLQSKIEKREEMTRKDLAEKNKSIIRQIQTELAQRLATAAKDRKDALGQWLILESIHLQAQQEAEQAKATEVAWKMLDEALQEEVQQKNERQKHEGQELDEEQEEVEAIRHLLLVSKQSRLVTLLAHLAAKPSAKKDDVDRLLKLCDDRIAQDAKQKEDEEVPPRLDWRQIKYNVLVALDRPKDLLAELAKWSAADTADRRWQKALAYLHAELGKVDDAIKLMEGLESSGKLTAADYHALATWCQAAKQDAKNAQAKVSLYKTMDEYSLRQLLYSHAEHSEVSPDDLLAYQAYFAKASNPQEGFDAVARHYRGTQDFRLLAALADAVIGHTSGQVYPFVSRVEGILGEIHSEATVDELAKYIAKVRSRTKSAVDLRALDLLELLVERRAAQVQNQPGPNIAAALAALKGTEKQTWSPGEPREFAQILTFISFTEQPELATEQLRIVGSLHAAAEKGSLDRLHLADLMATIHIRHNRHEQAIDLLTAACDEFRQAHGGKSTNELRPYLFSLISKLQSRGLFAKAESTLQEEMKRSATPQDAYELRMRLFDLYVSAIYEGGDTSLGKEQALFTAAEKQLLALLEATKDQRERLDYHRRLCDLFVAAHQRKIAAAAKDIAEFVAKRFPELAQGQITNYRSMVSIQAYAIGSVLGSRDKLAFYIDRLEHEPAWLARGGEDGWSNYHGELAQLRLDVKLLGDLEPRLLALVIAELKHELRTHTSRGGEIYSNDNGKFFWKEKTPDFAKAAEEVLAESPDGPKTNEHISRYLINSLGLWDRAVEILFAAHRRELLDESGQQLLITALFRQKRHGEAIGLLESLVRKHLKEIGWRTQLMHAYFMSRQPRALRTLLAQTKKDFIDPHPNDETMNSILAASTLENEIYEESAKYYETAIKAHTDAVHGRTQGDGTLAGYFQQQAKAYAGMQNTFQAVEKASAAIVIWPARHEQRTEAINLLRSLLNMSRNLDGYVAELDKLVEKDQQERPIVRKQIGFVYQEKYMAWDKAIKQLRLAVEAAPDDAEIHQRLIACLDAKGDAAGALAQTFESLDLSRRNLELWNKLAERFTALKQPVEAERAATSLVEVQPNEAEGHAKFASYREKQDRWDEAISHWREVARLRKLEPTGLLGLSPALLHQKRLQEFDAAMKQLENSPWPQHFQEKLKEELPKLRESRLKANK